MLDILFLSRSSLLYAVLLLSAITILSLALPCFAYDRAAPSSGVRLPLW